jgi:hypothetical protein
MKPSKFLGSISAAFTACIHVYVREQDKTLEGMLASFAKEIKPASFLSEELEEKILPTSQDLFVFFRKCIGDIIQLHCTPVCLRDLHSSHRLIQLRPQIPQAVFDLYIVFKKYLRQYATRVILANMPKLALVKKMDAELKLVPDEVSVICGSVACVCMCVFEKHSLQHFILFFGSLLNTAEYCFDTSKQLEEKLLGRRRQGRLHGTHPGRAQPRRPAQTHHSGFA